MQTSFLKALAKHIATQLKKRGFCIVFEEDLERCWPSKQMSEAEREREIQRFAEAQRWSAKIVEGGLGTRAIFEELRPGGW
jgi:muramoyltetrapeptide carboxypeptidase LdcA involved in peptidoglycan recycling